MEEIQLNNLGGGSGASGAAIEQINVATFVADDKDGGGKKERDSWGSKVCCITEKYFNPPFPLSYPSIFHLLCGFTTVRVCCIRQSTGSVARQDLC